MTLSSEAIEDPAMIDVCACGFTYSDHEVRNGYCPGQVTGQFRPATGLPVMALRPDGTYPDEMDDIVVQDVTMFRAEAMSENNWWLCCYFANGERVTFSVIRSTNPARLSVYLGETPPSWIDWDKHPEARR